VRAAEVKCEIGTSLVSSVIGLGDNFETNTFGIPSGGLFGIGSPGVYGTFFLGDRVGIEPQLNLIVVSDNGTDHILAFNGQFDYFMKGAAVSSLYLFGKVGVFDVSDEDFTPKVVGGGVGYRMPKGRLVLRLDGQILHYTDDGGNALVLGASIGGLFGGQ
jgi:hypothetical protein